MQRIYHDIRPEDLMRILKRAPLLCVALLSACSEGFAIPEVERGLPDVPVAKPALRAIGSWAYLWSPAVRAAILANSYGDRKAEARLPDLVASITESSVEVEPAALVGVYETDDQRLLLNAAGGYSLLPRAGHTSSATSEHGTWMVKGTELLLHGSSQNIRQLSLLPGAELLRWQEQVFQPATVRPPQPSNPDAFEGDDQ